MPERHVGKCPKCGNEYLYEFIFKENPNIVVFGISDPCPECAHEIEWDFLPKAHSELKDHYRVG